MFRQYQSSKKLRAPMCVDWSTGRCGGTQRYANSGGAKRSLLSGEQSVSRFRRQRRRFPKDKPNDGHGPVSPSLWWRRYWRSTEAEVDSAMPPPESRLDRIVRCRTGCLKNLCRLIVDYRDSYSSHRTAGRAFSPPRLWKLFWARWERYRMRGKTR